MLKKPSVLLNPLDQGLASLNISLIKLMKNSIQIICPGCKKVLENKAKTLACRICGTKYPLIQNIPNFLLPDDKRILTQNKWNNFYQNYSLNINNNLINKEIQDALKTISQINRYHHPKKNEHFLELGCGLAYYCYEYAKKGLDVYGIDFSLNALKKSKWVGKKRNGLKPHLFCADIENMPFGDNSFDLVYGGGVIEHLYNPEIVLREIFRVLKPGGLVFNTVPLLNLGSLTYRQLWGNIPYFPGLKQTAEFIHVKMLRAKHMRFGWEYSFSKNYLKKIHRLCGFKEVVVNKFEVELEFAFIKNREIKSMFNYLAQKSRLFWPMVYVCAKK